MNANLEKLTTTLDDVRREVRKVIIGQDEVVDQCLVVIFTGQHALIEGVPGLAKTLLARTLAHVLGCEFARAMRAAKEILLAFVLVAMRRVRLHAHAAYGIARRLGRGRSGCVAAASSRFIVRGRIHVLIFACAPARHRWWSSPLDNYITSVVLYYHTVTSNRHDEYRLDR